MPEPDCSTCRHWLPIPDDDRVRSPLQSAVAAAMDLVGCEDWLGCCLRFPPTISPQPADRRTDPEDMGGAGRRSAWPITDMAMRCGEHRPTGHVHG